MMQLNRDLKDATKQSVREASLLGKLREVDRHHPRPIRVLHVVNLELKNSAYFFNNLFDHFDRDEVQCLAFTFGGQGGFVDELETRGVKTYAVDCPNRRRYPRAVRKLWRVIENERIDIVHTHLFDPTLIGLFVAKMRKRKAVLTRHHSDAIHNLPYRFKRTGYLFLEHIINRFMDHIIAPSNRVRSILVEQEGVPDSKVSIIPYGQTLDRFKAVSPDLVADVRRSLGMEDQISFVCVSRLHKEKGHIYLFEALARLMKDGLNIRTYLVGIGPDRDELEQSVKHLGLENNVRFLGWREDALAIIAAADVVVHPSLHEALPSAVIESVLLERPLVVTDVSGVRDIVGDSEYAMVVPPSNAEAFYEALKSTIGNIDEARARARRGRLFILDYMDASRVSREYTACYKRLAGPEASEETNNCIDRKID